jgi:AraC family transcriptional regulator
MKISVLWLERSVHMGGKTKEQLLEELSEVQKMLEKRTETQGQMIRKFQLLMANDGLFSQIIDFFPYPIAIFTPQYTVVMVNKAFAAETKTRVMYPEKGAARILQHKINDMRLATAITGVFAGNTFFLEDLKNPFSMFSGITQQRAAEPDRFNRVVIFPVPADDAEITHGVIVFMP